MNFKGLGIDDSRVHIYGEIDSTNLAAIRHARERGESGIEIFIARSQTAGRGRLGRSFVSKSGAGIYLSLLIPSNLYRGDALTSHTAVSLARTLGAYLNIDTGIKWVNDIYLGGKKLCGILVEAVTSTDGKITDFVVGMGINVYKNAITPEIADIATSLEEQGILLCDTDSLVYEIVAGFIKDTIISLDKDALLSDYRRRSVIDGKAIEVRPVAGNPYEATAVGINDDFTLSVKLPCGEVRSLSSGEVKTKILQH